MFSRLRTTVNRAASMSDVYRGAIIVIVVIVILASAMLISKLDNNSYPMQSLVRTRSVIETTDLLLLVTEVNEDAMMSIPIACKDDVSIIKLLRTGDAGGWLLLLLLQGSPELSDLSHQPFFAGNSEVGVQLDHGTFGSNKIPRYKRYKTSKLPMIRSGSIFAFRSISENARMPL